MEANEYLEDIKSRLIASNVIAAFTIVEELDFGDRAKLRKRWDNVPHFPNLPNFPHHIHVESEENVISGNSLNIQELLDILEQEIEI